ncbi:hypothetical protein SJI00_13845 [Pseudomonas sp. RP23018S]|uniref:hypothetical protein n=1 Tax=Pseudomonas sp. RP23018S TaxID=3096037 RepID=UPI002ACAFCF4|nr:hypothetical protein [Pseudomonas sp. RP23018S]MDZ5603861.1 hypothetical protein [Pseudomonas sp. RP23018S]
MMHATRGAAAMGQWRTQFLDPTFFHEDDYDRALLQAQALEQAGAISTREWRELVRQANAALLKID